MRIFIDKLDGTKISLFVDPFDQVGRLKEMVEEEEGIGLEEQKLMINGEELRDDMRLIDCDVYDEAHITLMVGGRGELVVSVRIVGGGSKMEYEMNGSDSVLHLKEKIERNCKVETARLRLILNGTEMEDTQILEEFDIQPDSVVHLVLDGRGGS